ncbi:MAG TPA: hypothetical protein VMZ53_29095 [Kofleriaceae bacterium]|nr:hypothetical protein [Kofleriaceae bacterium]
MDTTADTAIRDTLEMPPTQLESILVHERTTAEDVVIELTKRKRKPLQTIHLVAISFISGIVLGLAAVAVV